MKAITLYQPWASLVAIGKKKIETRGWATKYRGPLAIHAAKDRQHWAMVHYEPFRSVFMDARLYRQDDLPYGAIIATCNLVEVCTITQDILVKPAEKWGTKEPCYLPLPDEPELSFGDYTPGRYAWILEDVRQLPEPIPAKGKQRLWTWEVPEEVVLP